jgi:hypothetical protein
MKGSIGKLLNLMVVASVGATIFYRYRSEPASLLGHDASVVVGSCALILLAVRIAVTAASVRRGGAHPLRLAIPLVVLIQGALTLYGGRRPGTALLLSALIVEAAIMAVVVVALVRGRRRSGALLEDRLTDSLSTLVPSELARLAALEMVLMTAVVCVPFRKRPAGPVGSLFTYSENSRVRALILAGPLVLFVEGIVIHQWLGPQHPWLRLLHIALCLYATLWIWGAYALMRGRPHRIDTDEIWIHRGIWGHLRIPLGDLTGVRMVPEGTSPPGQAEPGTIALTVKGTDQVEITLRAPVTAMGFLRPMKPGSRIVLSADDAPAFCAAVKQAADRWRVSV